MLKVEPYNHDINGEPEVRFATDAEIEVADQLRRQLEERYLVSSATSSQLQVPSSKDR
jgi:hypothetical protein